MSNPGTTEWTCQCKDCLAEFRYSNTNYEANKLRGFSRPERCPDCRKQHAKEVNTVGQPYFKVKPLYPNVDHEKLVSVLGRLKHPPRPHRAEHVVPPGEPPDKFGIKDDKIVEMFRWFQQDPGLQVVVVVGPTGSGKSTYFPYRLVHPPRWYTTTEIDPVASSADPSARRTICDKNGNPIRFDASDVQTDMFHRYGQIVVTQPRIQATRNIPGYIAKSMFGSSLGAGADIGYHYAKNPASDWRCKLRFCTDGSLINWIATGQLDKINTVMIDEAHERSLNIDIIIGLLTQALPRYPRLKLIIASATISADLFIDHFKRHLPKKDTVRELRIGDETKRRRKLESVTKSASVPMPTVLEEGKPGPTLERAWLLKPADNCELMEFDGKSFRVDPHFHDGSPLDYAYLDPAPKEKSSAEAVEARIQKLAKTAHEHVAAKAVGILKDMYLSAEELLAGKGLRATKSLEPDGTTKIERIVDVTERRGDVLGFLHGETPILECCKKVESEMAQFGGCKVEALPLFTQLPQSEQDKALLERKPGIHERLASRILEAVKAGQTDILAVSDNAGAVLGMQSETLEKMLTEMLAKFWNLEKEHMAKEIKSRLVLQRWSSEESLVVSPGATCRRNEQVKLIAKPSGGVRVVVASSRALAVWDVPYDGAKDGTQVNLAGQSFVFLSQEKETRRVVVSTNVAETSLTIHGILHVVDSGLINQNKWMPDTQTTGVRPILQSRAGCKQRWGRAGRLQSGDAWPLYTREQFGLDAQVNDPFGSPADPRCFPYYSLPEIRRSPLEQVLLTAKKAGIEALDVDNFPWLEAPEAEELKTAEASLKAKGALDDKGRLTAHGLELTGFQSEARLANLMVIADRMACAVEMATVLAVLKVGYNKLFLKSKEWDEATVKRVQEIQSALTGSCADDLEVALKVVAGVELARSAGQALADVWSWEENWKTVTQRYTEKAPEDRRKFVADFLEQLGHVDSEEGLKSIRPNKNDSHRELFNELRVEIDRGIRRKAAWTEVQSHWDTVCKLPEFSAVWQEAATAVTRIECVGRAIVEVARARPEVEAFLSSLSQFELPPQPRQPKSQGGPETVPAPDPAAEKEAADLRRERASKFLQNVADTMDKLGRELPTRDTVVIDPDTHEPKPDEEAAAIWRKLDSIAEDFVRKLGSTYRRPLPDSLGSMFVEKADAARTITDFRQLPSTNSAWIERVRSALPTAAAQAWCDSNFVDSRSISGKDKIEAARNELVDSLSGHKKEEERRPINFALLDRLRLIFAHALADHCYTATPDGYQQVLPGPPQLLAVIERDSKCGARSPDLIVCANRRALPADPAGLRRIGVGFVIALDGNLRITPGLIRGEDGRVPLGSWSAFHLAAHLPGTSPEEAASQTATARARLMLDQTFPLHSEWEFTLEERDGDDVWLASGTLQKLRPLVCPREQDESEDETFDEPMGGGDFTTATYSDERPDPVLDHETAVPDPDKRPIFVAESATISTVLAEQVMGTDHERIEELLIEQDSALADRPFQAAKSAQSTRFRIRFVLAGNPPETLGAKVHGWVTGFETDGPKPTVVVGRRDPRSWLHDLREGQEKRVTVIGRANGAKPGVRVRVDDTELEVTLSSRDFGFRDEDAVIRMLIEASTPASPLSFNATVWEVAPGDGILRLTTYPQVIEWCEQNLRDLSQPITGTVVRSNPAMPDRVSVLLHSDPSRGLVVAADASAAQFAGVLSGVRVQVKVHRPRDDRRPPEVKRTCAEALQEAGKALGLDVRREKTRYNRPQAMSLTQRADLLNLAPGSSFLRSIVDELFAQSQTLFADEAATGQAGTDVASNLSSEILARVIEVNAGGAKLESLDTTLPVARMRLWLANDEAGGKVADLFRVNQTLVVRPTGKLPAAGQIDVTLCPPPGWLTPGVPAKVEVNSRNGEPSGVQVIIPPLKLEVFCRLRELFPNVEVDPAQLLDLEARSEMPFMVLGPDPRSDRTDATLSHKRAALFALRSRHKNLIGKEFGGVVTRLFTRENAAKGTSTAWIEVEFGRKLRAQCQVSYLGIGLPQHLEESAKKALASGQFKSTFQITAWHRDDEFLMISARPAWERLISENIGQVVHCKVIEILHPFVNVELLPFVFGSFHVNEFATEKISEIGTVIEVGATIAAVIDGFDDQGRLQVSPKEAMLRELEDSKPVLKGTVVSIVGRGDMIIRLAPGITGFCPAREMQGYLSVGETCLVQVREIRREVRGTPIQLVGVEFQAAEEFPKPQPTLHSLQLAAPSADLPGLVEQAARDLLEKTSPLCDAIERRNLGVAASLLDSFRTNFPLRPEEVCRFSARLKLLSSLHDRFLAAGNAVSARLCWPGSPHIEPDAPSSLAAAVERNSVTLRWPRSATDSDVRYRVHRNDVLVVASLVECMYLDQDPPVGEQLHYSVTTFADGKESKPVRVKTVVPVEVTLLKAIGAEGQIALSWVIPPNAVKVEIWRKHLMAPIGRYDGQLVAQGKLSELWDTGLPKGELFGYRMIVFFEGATSNGEAIVGKAIAPPKSQIRTDAQTYYRSISEKISRLFGN